MPDNKDEGDRPKIDLSKALGEADHEVEDLGYEGVPDTGEVLKESKDSPPDVEEEVARDIATKFPAD